MIRVPDQMRRCVAFLMVSQSGRQSDVRPVGTAFWVEASRRDHAELEVRYLVTARHVIESARASGFEDLWLRVDTASGGTEFLRIPHDDWHVSDSPDYADDVAVPERAAMRWWQTRPWMRVTRCGCLGCSRLTTAGSGTAQSCGGGR